MPPLPHAHAAARAVSPALRPPHSLHHAPTQLAAYVVISFALMMMVALTTSIVGGALMLAVLDDRAPPTEARAEDLEPSASLKHSE
jgi:hypothetical protein